VNLSRLYRNINGKPTYAIVLTDGLSIITLDCGDNESVNKVIDALELNCNTTPSGGTYEKLGRDRNNVRR
jgi:hypothetical protein